MSGAIINDAILDHANLQGADLTNARGYYGTKLTDVILNLANLGGVNLTNADLTHTDFWGAKNLDINAVKRAFYWEKDILRRRLCQSNLGFDHSDNLSEQQKKKEKLQQKLISRQRYRNSRPIAERFRE